MIDTVRLRFLNSRRSSSGVLGTERVEDEQHDQRGADQHGDPDRGAVAVPSAGMEDTPNRNSASPGDISAMPRKSKDSDGSGCPGQHPPGVDDRDEADRRVDQEDPVPARDLDQPAADDRAEDRAEQHGYAEDRHQPAHPVRSRRPGHDRHAERHQHAATETLQDPEADQGTDAPRGRAEHRADDEERDGGHVEPLGAEPVGRPAGHRDHRGQREGVGGDRPGDRGVGDRVAGGAEHRLERRQRDVDDGDVQDGHDGAHHDHARHLEDSCVDVVGQVGQVDLAGRRHGSSFARRTPATLRRTTARPCQ